MVATLTSTRGSDLPNPWHRVAPVCPFDPVHGAGLVYLWHPRPTDGFGKWVCSPCCRRFDVPKPLDMLKDSGGTGGE